MEEILRAVDLAVVAAVVILTQVVKTYIRIPRRWVPLLPLAFGMIGMALIYDFSAFRWQGFVRTIVFYAAGASYAYNVWKKIIIGEE